MSNNIAFIDGQNLSKSLDWNINYKKFFIYLKDKYKIKEVYYFLAFLDKEQKLYENLEKAWFKLVFNQKHEKSFSNKKWNVDVNLAFEMMKWYSKDIFSKAVLVSWDWDFKPVVDFLIEEWKFLKVICPNEKFASSLYKRKKNLDKKYLFILDESWIRWKIEHKKKEARRH